MPGGKYKKIQSLPTVFLSFSFSLISNNPLFLSLRWYLPFSILPWCEGNTEYSSVAFVWKLPCFALRETWLFLWHLNGVGRQIGIWPTAALDVVPTSWTSALKILVTQTITEFPGEEKLNRWGYEPRPRGAFVQNTPWLL